MDKKGYNVLKIDLDCRFKRNAINKLRKRINFLVISEIFSYKLIESIELIKKSRYSAKITLNRSVSAEHLLILQAILGDDWKHTAIAFRDYCWNLNHWNRLFDVKRYPNGDYKIATKEDITSIIVNQ